MHKGLPTARIRTISLCLCWGSLALATSGCSGGASQPPPPSPVISSAGPTTPLGLPGTTATFEATATEQATVWDWNFGEGTAPPASTEARPSVLLDRSGPHQGTVSASNAAGASPPFSFNYQVATPQQGAWIESIFDSDLEAEFAQPITSTIAEDRILVSYRKSFVQGFTVALSGPIAPSGNPGAWTKYRFEESMAVVGGPIPYVNGIAMVVARGSHSNPPATMQLLYSDSTAPLSVSNWTFTTFEADAGDNRAAVLLKMPSGWMVCAHTGPAFSPTNIEVYRTLLEAPSAESDWTSYVAEANTAGFGADPRLLMYRDKPVLHYDGFSDIGLPQDPARIALATVAEPRSSADWVSYVVVDDITDSDLTILHDRLALIWTSPQTVPAIRFPFIKLQLARNNFPQSAADWDSVLVREFDSLNFEDGEPNFPADVSVSAPYGRLLIAFRGIVPNFQDPYLLRATAAFPQGPEDWEQRLLVEQNASSGASGFEAHAVSGRLVTAFNSPNTWTAQLSDGPW